MAKLNISLLFLSLLFLLTLISPQKFKFCSANEISNSTCQDAERKALLTFKKGLTDPSGRLDTWVGTHCCSWAGVVCRTGHVTRLELGNDSPDFDLESYALGGKISSSLLDLKYLNYLDLSLNNFGGISIPEFFGSFEKLSSLNLSGSSFSSPISHDLGNLTSLMVLDLSYNGFNSTVPPWIFNLTSLVYLDLSSNNFQGDIDEFSRLSFLEVLDLSENSFISGILSGKLGESLCRLHFLDLSFNSISGEINEFANGLARCNDSSLESMHLGYNKLGGVLPNSLGNLRRLKLLNLIKNSFLGSIPESIGNLSTLREFYLSDNQMKGSIPASLGQLTSLVVLDISQNQWEGIITEAHFSNLTSLEQLAIEQSVKNITLFFNISPDWIPPFKLTFLELKACMVGPKFPRWLQNQNMLTHVGVWFANISDEIPGWFWELDLFLDRLDFSYNQLTGEVPETIRFREQAVVFLNYNKFTGFLPLLSSNVSSYHLDNNLFSGPIPLDFGDRMPFLVALDVSYNSLNGTIPMSMSKLTNLNTFVLSSNNLTGKIPEIWSNMPYLYVIDVSNNSLTGNIPETIGSITEFKFLRLSNNKLSGELPSSLQNCTLLETLDIGENRFSGKVPAWIGEKLTSLLIISLRSNSFTGEIPTNLCSLSSLHILDLAENSFFGHIPSCIGNLSGMNIILDSMRYEGQLWLVAKSRTFFYDGTLYLVNSIDLSSNDLYGEMPIGLSNLSRLGTLNLSMNHLTGKIPADLGEFKRLETLDLSSNNLSGTIPTSLTYITSLNHLNLSYNNLSGPIPTANQFQTLNDPSIYEGNYALCGIPLPVKCNNGDKDEKSIGSEEDEGENEMFWFYVAMAPGFVVGFWVVCGTLIVKKSWRIAYYNFFDDKKDCIFAYFSVTFNRFKKFLKRKDN